MHEIPYYVEKISYNGSLWGSTSTGSNTTIESRKCGWKIGIVDSSDNSKQCRHERNAISEGMMGFNNQGGSRGLARFVIQEVKLPQRSRLIQRRGCQFRDIVIHTGVVWILARRELCNKYVVIHVHCCFMPSQHSPIVLLLQEMHTKDIYWEQISYIHEWSTVQDMNTAWTYN